MNGMSRQDRRISLVRRHRSAQEYQDNEFVLDVLTLVRSTHILSTYLSVAPNGATPTSGAETLAERKVAAGMAPH